ncbi:PIG-L family deacetylase [Herbiconiux sp. YIM B11900]|uniref:PIG-L family deacetylase n=1 Tax=Herbiconiux sp. YIM B11900 TaxID=3404131 RepID=UPI003F85AEBF
MTASESSRPARPDLTAFGAHPVFLHAHPDDESISTGGTIAALRASGVRVTVITGTRGEQGEVVAGPFSELEGTSALGPHRETELAAALGALRSPEHRFLGAAPSRVSGLPDRVYADSGMRWAASGFAEAADDAGADSLSLSDVGEELADLLAAFPRDATAVVGYDALGGYGHPDHVRMHELGLQTARERGLRYLAIVEPRVADDASAPAPESDLTVDVGPQLAAKVAAMAAHATQLTIEQAADGTPWFVLSGGQRHPVAGVERYRRLL